MTSQERTLSALVGVLLALFVVGIAGYFFVYQPITSLNAEATSLESDITAAEFELAKAVKEKKRLDIAWKRSLPDSPHAAQEYEAALAKVLRDAQIPAGSYEIKFRPADGRPIPEIALKKPAYSRVVVELTLKKVTFAQTLGVLDRYYALNLLQQITKFNVKRVDDPNAKPASSTSADRPDLTVSFTTEAITLDGAEKRGTLLAHPVGAVASGLAYAVPSPARGLTPIQWAPVLATTDRDYSMLVYKDIFHGPPPPPPPPKKEVIVVAPPKEDTSPFIRLTALGRSSDGSGMAVIEDLAAPGKMEYTISIKRTSDGLVANVAKDYFLKGKRKPYDASSPVLDISEASSGTARKFRVVGVDGDTLVLAERKSAIESASVPQGGPPGDGGRPPGGGFGGKRPSRSSTPPLAAIVGGVMLGVPTDTVFAWRHGDPLSKIKELTRDDAAQAVRRATGLASVAPAAPSVPFAAPVVGSAAAVGK